VNLTLVLADTGRQTPAGLSLLQVGWKATFAVPTPDGSITLPEQAVVIFITAEFAEINRTHDLALRLVDLEDKVQHFSTGEGLIDAEVHRQVFIPQVMGASLGADSLANVFFQFPMGSIRINSAPGWYRWTCRLSTGDVGEVGFMVNQPPTDATFGPLGGGRPGQ
jgi:hypothetical protein